MTVGDPAISVHHLTKRYRDVTAVDDASFTIARDSICGLLGRNGAGKSTAMHLITAQAIPTSGEIRVFGHNPYENQQIQAQLCFIKESQKYPDDFRVRDVLQAASWFFPNWEPELAARLLDDFNLPLGRRMKKLSRGMLSAVAITVGIASRAPISFFDEPYLGLDAVARQLFYDRLLEDYAVHPRTVVMSTHLIDEIADLLSHVVVIDKGKIIIDAAAEDLRGASFSVTGARQAVDDFTRGHEILHRRDIGGLATVAIAGSFDAADRARAATAGLEIAPVSLQQLIVNATRTSERAA